jgi:hypothetical protein
VSGRDWTPEEVASLNDLRAVRGWPCSAIGATMERSARSVRYKINALGIELPATKKIGCLRDDTVLREAFSVGASIKSVAKSLGIEKRAVAHCYNRFSAELMQAGSDFVPTGSYIGVKEMARIVAPVCGAPARAILSESRYRPAVLGRMAIARALRDRGLSMPTIARTLGRADHTTVLNNLNRFDDYLRHYPQLQRAYDAIKDAEGVASVRLAA